MKTINKNRFIIFLAIITMLLMVIPTNNVLASSVTYPISFELPYGHVNTQYDNGFLKTQVKLPYLGKIFNVTSVNQRSGLLAFSCSDTMTGGTETYGWWNFTYSKTQYITKIKLGFGHISGGVSGDYICFYFYNKTTQASKINFATPTLADTTNTMMSFVFSRSVGNMYAQTKGNSNKVNATSHEFISLNITNTDGYQIPCYTDSAGKSYTYSKFVPYNSTCYSNNCRIDACYIWAFNTGCYTYMDDCNFTVSDSYSGGTVSGCSDFTGNTPTGRFAYGSTDVDSIHISTLYNVPVSTTITGVELQISENQYDSDSDLSHYGCSINGISIGTAKCIFSESYYYVVQWETTTTITDEMINFDFSHTQLISGTQYWDVGCGVSSTDDVNGDGEIGFYWQDDSVVYHWEWYYWVYMLRPTYGAGSTFFNRDLGMRFWSTGFATAETYDYVDTLGLANYYSYNTTGYIYDLTQGYENIMGAYTLGNPSLAYTLNLYVNNTKVLQYGFPINCRYPGSGFGFSPNTIGKYRIQMNTTHAVANVTAWVTGLRPIYSIRTNPVISDQFMTYSISAYYNNPQGYTGGVAMDNYKQMLNSFFTTMYQRYPIQNNMTTTFSYQSNTSMPEYWGLYTNLNGLYNKVADATHYIRIPSIYENEIHTSKNNYPCPANTINELSISVEGTHIFPGADVRLYANSIEFAKVGDNQQFIQQFTPKKFGAFNISMYLIQNGTTKMLAQCNFTVSPSDLPGIEDETNPMISFIPEEYYIYIAIGIIIGFMFAPIFFIYTMKMEFSKVNVTLEVPGLITMVLSIMMGIVAFILNVMWGLLEWWTVFFFIFVLVLITIILWLKGGSSST
jgi:hypothetical protein